MSSSVLSVCGSSLLRHNVDADLVLWDNSSQGYNLKEEKLNTSELGKIFYHHCPDNWALGKVYNEIASSFNKYDCYLILDDDSEFSSDFFESFINFFRSDVLVALPRIFYDGALISPGRVSGVRGKMLDPSKLLAGPRASNGIVGMMSGTFIKRDVFDKGLRFTEKLSFYGVDTKFFIDFASVYSQIYVLDYDLLHDSALRDKNASHESRIARFYNLLESKIVVFEGAPAKRLRLSVYYAGFILKCIVSYKSLKYIRLFRIYSLLLGLR